MKLASFASTIKKPHTMFGNKKKPDAGVHKAKFMTLIAQDVHLTGTVEFSEGLRLDGHLQGNIASKPGCQTLLVLSDLGSITGNVHGYDVVVNGKIVGDVIADHYVELQPNAHITGNIDYQNLRMDTGATVDGKLTHREAASAAPTMLPHEPKKQGSVSAA
jgi:cytoskeletal protein CcmA (bactofilin family)